MLRPWVPLIALALLSALTAGLGQGFLALLGGVLLAAALVSELAQRFTAWRRRPARPASALRRAAKLDWTIIDNSMAQDRERRDCERPETLGVCTGLECLVYKTCRYNLKKPLP